MLSEKTYILVCHGCGKFHEKKSCFMSTPLSIGFTGTGDRLMTWAVPAMGCPDCMAVQTPNRDDHPIRRAWLNGMTPEARERANREFKEWEPKLEAKHGSSRT